MGSEMCIRDSGGGADASGGGSGGADEARGVVCERCEVPWGDGDGALAGRGGAHRANVWHGTFPGTFPPGRGASAARGGDGYSATAPVRAFGAQNGYGLYNMIGNVWEWAEDVWRVDRDSPTPTRAAEGAAGGASVSSDGGIDDGGVERVKKGGSFLCHSSYCYRYRISARTASSADSSSSNLGFRCAQPLELDGEDSAEREVEARLCSEPRAAGGGGGPALQSSALSKRASG